MQHVDATEPLRRLLIPQMPAVFVEALTRGERIWNTEAFREDFEALGFMAPLVVVRRLSDGVEGALMFTHHPRYYFNFQPVEDLSGSAL